MRRTRVRDAAGARYVACCGLAHCPVQPGADFLAAVGARHDFKGCRGPLIELING